MVFSVINCYHWVSCHHFLSIYKPTKLAVISNIHTTKGLTEDRTLIFTISIPMPYPRIHTKSAIISNNGRSKDCYGGSKFVKLSFSRIWGVYIEIFVISFIILTSYWNIAIFDRPKICREEIFHFEWWYLSNWEIFIKLFKNNFVCETSLRNIRNNANNILKHHFLFFLVFYWHCNFEFTIWI